MSVNHISIATPQPGTAERDRIMAALESGTIADGPEVRGFKRGFVDYCEADHGVATFSGTAALHATLRAFGVGPGDRVLTVPSTFTATANVVAFAGAEVGFVDIDPRTHNIDPDTFEARLRADERVGAVIAVHLYGPPADMTRLVELVAEYDFPFIEDAAQVHGATVEGRRVGSFGDAACFSFYPTKNMATSEGDMITTDRADVVEHAVWFVDYGHVSDYEYAEVGHNFRMMSTAAAVSWVQLERLPGFTCARRVNATVLTEYLEDLPATTPHTPPGRTRAFHQYIVACDGIERDALKSYPDVKGTAMGAYCPKPVHKQPAYEHLAVSAPVAEGAATRVLSLSVHLGLSEADAERVGTMVVNYAEVVR